MTIDTWGHIGYLLIFAGMSLLGRKAKLGWISRLLGDGVWCVVGLTLGMTSIWLWGLAFMMNDVLSYRRWGKTKSQRDLLILTISENDTLQSLCKMLAEEPRLSPEDRKLIIGEWFKQ